MSYIRNKDILGDEMPLNGKIRWMESCYVYSGIMKEIEDFKENTGNLRKEKQQKALNFLSELVKNYKEKHVISAKSLEDRFRELKFELRLNGG